MTMERGATLLFVTTLTSMTAERQTHNTAGGGRLASTRLQDVALEVRAAGLGLSLCELHGCRNCTLRHAYSPSLNATLLIGWVQMLVG